MPLPKVKERIPSVRTTTREGDTSPKMSALVSGERTPEARKKREKAAQNKQKRIQRKEEERRALLASESLAKQMASFREIKDSGGKDNLLTENSNGVQTVVASSVKNKKGFPSSHYVGKTKKVVRGTTPARSD